MYTHYSHQKKKAWQYICIAHCTRCICDRSFSFFLPLYLSKQCSHKSTLRPTAALTFVQNLSVVLLSTSVAKIYRKKLAAGAWDGRSREKSDGGGEISSVRGEEAAAKTFYIAIAMENTAVALLGFFMYAFFNHAPHDNGNDYGDGVNLLQHGYCEHPFSSHYFCIAVLCGCIDAVSIMSLQMNKIHIIF